MSELPTKTQDYLKLVWDVSERTGSHATIRDIASALGQRTSTTSEAIKRLAEKDLVVHEPYGGIALTEEGRRHALVMVRRHRLIEAFLVHSLGYAWDEIHEEADALEHAVSEKFIERIDEILGHPTHDPHGDPIPSASGDIENVGALHLGEVPPDTPVTVSRIHDCDAELLRYLAQNGITPGTQVQLGKEIFGGMSLVVVGDREVALAEAALAAINVTR